MTLKTKAMEHRSGPHYLEKDDFIQECRNSLVEIAASLSTPSLHRLVKRLERSRGLATKEQHQDWLDSPQFKAIKLETLLRGQSDD